MRIYELIVEPEREEHIARHHVTVAEVEEVVSEDYHVSRTRQKRWRLIGQTAAGRYLTVIVAPHHEPGHYLLITARDADAAERRLYQRRRRR